MADKKRSFRKEYLNDFQRDINGKFVYMGQHMLYSAENRTWRKETAFLWACCLIPAALIILTGVLPESGMMGNALLMIPYALMLITLFIVIWKLVRLTYAGSRMRSYVHDQTVKVLPIYSIAAAACGAAGSICMIISLIIRTFSGTAGAVILYLLLGCSQAAGGILLAILLRKEKWTVE